VSVANVRLALDTVLGRMVVRAPSEELARGALEPAIAAMLGPPREGEPVELSGRPAWLKAGSLGGKAAWRYGLRRALLRMPPPRVRELENLAWLRARLFRAPEPLAAGFIARGPRLRFQFLLTARLEGVQPLDRALDDADRAQRAELLEELARETARMHGLRFVHHDLYLRNILVTPIRTGEGDPRRLVFVDAWRGGPRYPWRDAAYDLGCLMLEGAGLLDRDEQRTLVRIYLEERAAQGRPADAPVLLAAAGRERAAQLRRARREPERWRRAEPPVDEWDAASLSG
jgi:hypothetical protein